MKTLQFISLGIVLFFSNAIHAQVSVNVNIGTPPAWGPPITEQVRYYYLPDVEAYYDINSSMFLYFGTKGKWIRARNLPRAYRNYDLYNGQKVVINNYYGSSPYVYYKKHKAKYHGHHYESREHRGNRKNYVYNSNRSHDDRDHHDHGKKRKNRDHDDD
ncbi:hypothetical protein [Flavobacterium sp. '19STA2R22 D10 B1']|uniref:hypothetical protein n=1 Tax=Flavobacterium aerium TaxID=3037261 RepID=UPI00278C7A3C|nr:hypothetical protein [Flavobacterium sp. '19STA2R22 D10 B1']